MSAALKFVAPRVPLVDARTGLITREWLLFLQGLYDRAGGALGSSTDELSALEQFDVRGADAAEIGKRVDALREAVELLPDSTAALAQIRAAVDEVQLAADVLASQFAAAQAETRKRLDDIDTLGAFTK